MRYGEQLNLPLEQKADSVIELALGFTRQIPLLHLERKWLEANAVKATDAVGTARTDAVNALMRLKSSLIDLDKAMGFDPFRFEVSSPSSNTTEEKEK